jgi:hypothetical protein
VLLNGDFAARKFLKLRDTDHDGKIYQGSATVLIGGPNGMGALGAGTKACAAMAAGRVSGKINQSYGNCMLESIRQLLLQMGIRGKDGKELTEDEVFHWGVVLGGSTFNPGRGNHGATSGPGATYILAHYGVQAECVPAHPKNPNLDDVKTAIAQRKGVIIMHDARKTWPTSIVAGMQGPGPSGHAVLATAMEVDDDGILTAVFVNDTGIGQCRMKVPAAKMAAAMKGVQNGTYAPLVVTKDPIW